MAATVARTQTDVDNMTKKDRLWDSMNYTYGTAREDIAKQYAKAFSQTDNQLLGRGMQRSSYGAQTLANLQQQGIKAQEDSWNQQIADYENRLMDIENQEWQQNFQEKQFDEGVRQYEQNFAYQQGRDTVTDRQWQMAFDQGNTDNDRQLAASYVNALLAKGQMPTDDLLARAGLSKADAQKFMSQQVAASGGGRGTKKATDPMANKSDAELQAELESMLDVYSGDWSTGNWVKDLAGQYQNYGENRVAATGNTTKTTPTYDEAEMRKRINATVLSGGTTSGSTTSTNNQSLNTAKKEKK